MPKGRHGVRYWVYGLHLGMQMPSNSHAGKRLKSGEGRGEAHRDIHIRREGSDGSLPQG
jgi:hypothetical protein